MALPPDQLSALRNLARKKTGEEVDWINISAARALTELGLAERDAAGWGITEAGQAALAAHGADTSGATGPTEVTSINRT